MAQCLEVLAAFPEALSFFPSTHVGWPVTLAPWNLMPLLASMALMYTHTHTYTERETEKDNKITS